jgi:hypothetical protein
MIESSFLSSAGHVRPAALFFVSLRDAFNFKAAGAPRHPSFFLLAQKKEGKEKGTLLARPAAALRFTSLTGARQLATLRHASLFSRQGLRCSTR